MNMKAFINENVYTEIDSSNIIEAGVEIDQYGTIPEEVYLADMVLHDYTQDEFIRGQFVEMLPTGMAVMYGVKMYELGKASASA